MPGLSALVQRVAPAACWVVSTALGLADLIAIRGIAMALAIRSIPFDPGHTVDYRYQVAGVERVVLILAALAFLVFTFWISHLYQATRSGRRLVRQFLVTTAFQTLIIVIAYLMRLP